MNLAKQIERQLGPIRLGNFITHDGQPIAYQILGEGPPILWANGIGVRYLVFHHPVSALRARYQHIFWDYRGIGGSPMNNRWADVSIPRHAQDAAELLEHLQLSSVTAIGWSMGVQVLLEVLRRQPRLINGFVSLHGAPGKIYYRAFPRGGLAAGIGKVFAWYAAHPQVLQRFYDIGTLFPRISFELLGQLSFVNSKQADAELFELAVNIVAEAEKTIYSRTMLALAEHEASDVLAKIQCPTLVITGSRDYLTPPRVGRQMAASIAHAQYREVPGATHFTLMEQPALITKWISELLEQVYPTENFQQIIRR